MYKNLIKKKKKRIRRRRRQRRCMWSPDIMLVQSRILIIIILKNNSVNKRNAFNYSNVLLLKTKHFTFNKIYKILLAIVMTLNLST